MILVEDQAHITQSLFDQIMTRHPQQMLPSLKFFMTIQLTDNSVMGQCSVSTVCSGVSVPTRSESVGIPVKLRHIYLILVL